MSGIACTRCVMRSDDDPDLVLADGVCNHCRRYDELISARVVPGPEGEGRLREIAKKLRAQRSRHGYDCLIGVSGGVDSSYVAYRVKELGLNPLAVHVDNGWNSEAAVANVERVLRRLDIDLHTEVLRLREFYDLQRAFLFASTPDGDIPADHAIQATLWKTARHYGIRTIISGMNFRTEAISVPSWSYGHSDWRYIHAIHKAFGTMPLRGYPHFGFSELAYTSVVRRIRILSLLNYGEYDKQEAMRVLSRELGWVPYGGKHYESIYTRFYQGYVLRKKFGIDKRRGHLSDLINSGQLAREEALTALAVDDYPGRLCLLDKQLFLKKLALSAEEFDAIMSATPRTFSDFDNSYERVQFLRRTVNTLRAKGWYPR